jgi:light-regulated signal transduction histidine kinase (bacteriophytochrome)
LQGGLAASLSHLSTRSPNGKATVTHDELLSVRCDVIQLSQLLQNLIANPLKSLHPDRLCRVHIGVKHQEGKWVFDVRDNGIGIDSEHYERVFVIIQRLHSEISTRDGYRTGNLQEVC